MKNIYLLLLFSSLLLLNRSLAQYSAPTLQWQKCLGGSGYDMAADVLPLSDGGYLIIGRSFSNDGDVSGHHGSTSTSDGWIVRLSAARNIVWQKSVGGTANDDLKSVIKTKDGNYVAVGTTASNDGDVTGNHGSKDIWVVKFDDNGNLLWNKCFGGSLQDSVGNIAELAGGSLILAGTTNSNNGNLSGTGTRSMNDVWYFSLNPSGLFQWGNVMGNLEDDAGGDIRRLPDGNLVFSVEASLDNDGQGDFPPVDGFDRKPWMVKIDTAGVVLWKYAAGDRNSFNFRYDRRVGALQLNSYGITLADVGVLGSGFNEYNEEDFAVSLSGYDGISSGIIKKGLGKRAFSEYLQILLHSPNCSVGLPDSTLLLAGEFSYTPNYDWQPNDTSIRAFLIKRTFKKNVTIDTAARFFGGSLADGFYSIKPDAGSNQYVVAGFTYSNDGDVSGNHGSSDVWLVGVADSSTVQKNIIQGFTFVDRNNNQVFDGGDTPFDRILVKSTRQSDNQQIAAIPHGGIYFNEVDTGTYVTVAQPQSPIYTVTPASGNSVFSNYSNRDTVSFIVTPIPGKVNLSLSLAALQPAYVGGHVDYQLQYTNDGVDDVTNRVVELIKDSRLEYREAVPVPDYVNGDTLRWTVDLLPLQSASINVNFYIPTPPDLNNGDTLRTTACIDTTGDVQSSNNFASLQQIAIEEVMDPNYVLDNTGGFLFKDEYERGDNLTYTIHFSNAGTTSSQKAAPATVIIKDSLDQHLDGNTIEIVGASHPYQFSMVNGKYCTWTLEGATEGYVIFKVKPVRNLSAGTTIRNSATIEYGGEPAVATNTSNTVIKFTPPAVPAISGLQHNYCGSQQNTKGKITNWPAAGNDIIVTANLDGQMLSIGTDSTFNIDMASLNGEHTIAVTYSNSTAVKTTTVSFTVTPAQTPQVKLTANKQVVADLANAIIITAGNTAHGGVHPLYTFAADRNFTRVLQSEGGSAVLTLQPHSLKMGDNWIYVSMKSSQSCTSLQTVIDSIKIYKNAFKGIEDADDPGQPIIVSPNPFRGQINIQGLNVAKTYTITLTGTNGQLLVKKTIAQRANINLSAGQLAGGVYWLSIHDNTKNRLLGTIQLVRQ